MSLLRHLGAVVVLAWTLALTACIPNSSPEEVRVFDIRVLDAAGGGLVTYLEQRKRTPSNSYTWYAQDGQRLLRRIDNDTLKLGGSVDFLPVVPADLAPARVLWTAQQSGSVGEYLTVCFLRVSPDAQTRCTALGGRTDLLDPMVLAADGRGNAVLLSRQVNEWHWTWVPTDGVDSPRQADLPAGVVDPRLVHGSAGAHVAWVNEGALHVLKLEPTAMRWVEILGVGAGVTRWAFTRQRGEGGEPWVAFCDADGASAFRLDGRLFQPLPAPPVDCSAAVGPLQLAVSAQGEAMLIWADRRTSAWLSARFSGGSWQLDTMATVPDTAASGLETVPRLAADDDGRFAALDLRADLPLRLLPWLPGRGWLAPIELATDPVAGAGADLALHEGTAHVAWGRPAGFDVPGSRLATARVDLAAERATLSVVVSGDGSVVSTPAGIGCPGDCALEAAVGTRIELQARPAAGQRLVGWDGLCRNSLVVQPNPLILLMPAGGGSCVARFEATPMLALDISVQGAGTVSTTPSGSEHPPGTVVTLLARPDAGQRFVGWGGDADCADGQVTMDAARSCSAFFEPDPGLVALTLSVTGGGRVRSAPAGLNCTATCSAYFALGQSVVLTAEPPAGAGVAWSGACSAAGTSATVFMGAAVQCSVAFTLPPPTGWQTLGGTLPGGGGLEMRPTIATDAQGVPTVAFLSRGVNEYTELNVLRLEGTGWRRVGAGPLNDGIRSAGQPSIALDAQGQPLVAFPDANGRLQLRHWDGGQWQRLADGLTVSAGARTGSPQVAFDGQRAVLAFIEIGGSGQMRLAVMRSELASPSWAGGYVDGVVLDGSPDLRLALDAAGAVRIAYTSGSGLSGQQAPRVVQESASGWAPLCDGGAGDDPGTGYTLTTIGFGLQTAADDSALLVRPLSNATAVQAWRCFGSGPWLTEGAAAGRLVEVDNRQTFLQDLAMAGSGTPTVVVTVGLGYADGAELHAFAHAAGGFASVGPPLVLAQRAAVRTLAVASGTPGAPVAAYGVEGPQGRAELQAARHRP